MRYVVEVDGRSVEVEVRDGARGAEARVGKGEWGPARLVGLPAPRLLLERGTARDALLLEADPMEPGPLGTGPWLATVGGRAALPVRVTDARARVTGAAGGAAHKGPRPMKSPMPGVVVEVRVEVGAVVERGHVLLVLEAMKMQNELKAEARCVVIAVHARKGGSVAAGAKLLDLGPPPA